MHLQEREILHPEALIQILKAGKYTTLALCSNNVPYVVTLSYGFDEAANTLFFHSSPTGLKLTMLQANPTVCGTVVEDRGYVDGQCQHAYRSVVFNGQMVQVEDEEEKHHGMRTILFQLDPDPEKLVERLKRTKFTQKTIILKLTMQNIRGKEGQ